jgi:HPt (histidine-containing phosphotransfer) domain-containing protein
MRVPDRPRDSWISRPQQGKDLEGLRGAALQGDAAAMQRVAHTLKSTSSMLGATALSGECAELEGLSRTGTVPDALARLAAVATVYEGVTLALTTKPAGPDH